MQQPSTQTIQELFNGRIQFVVPLYQRRYIWTERDNWSLLWDDIAETADSYLADTERHSEYRHFLGPIVLEQQHSEPGGVDPRLVIDGQQRLTTIQVLLSVVGNVARAHGADGTAAEVEDLIFNRGAAAVGDARVKVFPSRRDRETFMRVINPDSEIPEGGEGIVGAWHYFKHQIQDWLDTKAETMSTDPAALIERLRICIDSLLYVVAINLDQTDNAQVIFETLNARGTGLGALDLVKNATFLQAERDELDVARLNDEQWEPTFEADDYWADEERQGREKRPRSDWFLMHWLAMELEEVVRVDRLFDTFRRYVLRTDPAPNMDELVATICRDAGVMRSFAAYEPGTPEELFFSRLETLDTTTLLPIALLLFRSDEVSQERRARALAALESWLVRRAVLRYTTRNYNRLLTGLLSRIKAHLPEADVAVVRELRASDADTAIWPGDEELRARLEGRSTYGHINQRRVRMLLEACERDVRDSTRTEDAEIPAGLTIEHAMPQDWEDNWPLPDGSQVEEAAENRNAHIHRIGNLTLITQPLNSALSNAAWVSTTEGEPSKRKELRRRSVLLINQRLCENDSWDEGLIDQRGSDMTDRITRTWPGPDSDVWPDTLPEEAETDADQALLAD